jgi:hypothetical protein
VGVPFEDGAIREGGDMEKGMAELNEWGNGGCKRKGTALVLVIISIVAASCILMLVRIYQVT